MANYGNDGVPKSLITARQSPDCKYAQEGFCVWCALGPDAPAKIDLLDLSWGYDVGGDELVVFWPNDKWHGRYPHRTWRVPELSQITQEKVDALFSEIADYVASLPKSARP